MKSAHTFIKSGAERTLTIPGPFDISRRSTLRLDQYSTEFDGVPEIRLIAIGRMTAYDESRNNTIHLYGDFQVTAVRLGEHTQAPKFIVPTNDVTLQLLDDFNEDSGAYFFGFMITGDIVWTRMVV